MPEKSTNWNNTGGTKYDTYEQCQHERLFYYCNNNDNYKCDDPYPTPETLQRCKSRRDDGRWYFSINDVPMKYFNTADECNNYRLDECKWIPAKYTCEAKPVLQLCKGYPNTEYFSINDVPMAYYPANDFYRQCETYRQNECTSKPFLYSCEEG